MIYPKLTVYTNNQHQTPFFFLLTKFCQPYIFLALHIWLGLTVYRNTFTLAKYINIHYISTLKKYSLWHLALVSLGLCKCDPPV